MSSQITRCETQLLVLNPPVTTKLCTDGIQYNKRSKLVRTTSLDRFKKFNTYICSQNYFILPAILTWLRTSQNIFQSNLEKCIGLVKFLIFNSFLYKYSEGLFLQGKKRSMSFYEDALIPGLKVLAEFSLDFCCNFRLRMSSLLFTLSVYLTVSVIFVQLLLCVYLMSSVFIPTGFLFLLACLYLISHINLKCLHFFLEDSQKTAKGDKNRKARPVMRLSRKYILGKRTISNFNFF